MGWMGDSDAGRCLLRKSVVRIGELSRTIVDDKYRIPAQVRVR